MEAFFLSFAQGQRFCVFHHANGVVPRGLVLYVHPFAEEMNKSRRIAAVQARALASAGYMVLQLDLLGCGDSSGDFGDAGWLAWVDDVVQASAWLRQRATASGATIDSAPLCLWGLRAGTLLCCQAATQIDEPCNFLFWQPPASGKQLLRQFLRLRLAADLLERRETGELHEARAPLEPENPVEVAGYTITRDMASGFENAILKPPAKRETPQRLLWLEISALDPSGLQNRNVDALLAWEMAGYIVERCAIAGDAFWLSSEPKENSQLIAATSAWFERESRR